MSVNSAHANGGVLIFNGEIILLYCDGVELHIEGSDAKDFSGTKKGRIYLTSHRMIFTNKQSSDRLQSFSFPFFSMTHIDLEQPIFGANYIKGIVTAENGGNWTGRADFKLKFMSGGAIEFGQAMLQAAKMASRYMPPQPPAYIPHQGPYYPAQPPAYTPPPGGYYGFVAPTHVFPDSPPPNTVFMSNMPPPYPGISPPAYAGAPMQPGYAPAGSMPPNPPSYSYGGGPPPPQPGFNPNLVPNGNQAMYNGASAPPGNPSFQHAKAQEAMGTAYYNPYDPNQVYVPQMNGYQQAPQYEGPPPPYAEPAKKNQ